MKHTTIALTTAILAACGGSDSSSNTTPDNNNSGQTAQAAKNAGVFLDSPIANISYKTATQSGKTNAKGEFGYNDGESVTFSIGSVTFPAVSAKETVTPLDIFDTTDISNAKVVNAIRLIQSLDKDANPDNGIQITDTAKTAATKALDFELSETDFASAPAVLSLVQAGGQDTKTDELITKEKALLHFQNSLKKNNISFGKATKKFTKSDVSGKTFYYVFKDAEHCGTSNYVVESFTFNANNTYILEPCKGSTEVGTYSITESGDIKIAFGKNNKENEYIKLATRESKVSDWEVCYTEQPVSEANLTSCSKDYSYVFFNKADAQAYIDKKNPKNTNADPENNSQRFVSEEIVGKTIYFAIRGSDCNENGLAVEYTKFNVNGTTTNTYCDEKKSAGSYKIFADGTMQLNYTATDDFYYGMVSKNPAKGDWLVCASETRITSEQAKNCQEKDQELAFFSKSDAQAYVDEQNGK